MSTYEANKRSAPTRIAMRYCKAWSTLLGPLQRNERASMPYLRWVGMLQYEVQIFSPVNI
jgi:hypothetical protein